ncbi:MAG: bifunctional DNA primase/polymerase [Alphaproteobacteria bacterium]|nr:bifunctional DNA primase/polymerase [Alphaproteobacteria bacterium]
MAAQRNPGAGQTARGVGGKSKRDAGDFTRTDNDFSTINAALALANAGVPVFPAAADKRPLPEHGFKNASAVSAVVRDLWRRWPGPLVGIRTGTESGLDVLDLDRQHGAAAWWVTYRDRIPNTRTHRTRSGGLHLLFRHLPGLRCSTAKVGPGVDIKADGGCCIWWPSAGLPVLVDMPLTDLAGWPQWLIDAALPPPKPVYVPKPLPADGTRAERYARAALRHAADRVATAPTGSRNDILNRETHALARFIIEGTLDPQDIANALAVAALAAGLDRAEVVATIASGLRAAGGAQ